jgi:uncharacterized protein YqcC (DUF446 family)
VKPDYAVVSSRLGAIEDELKRISWWQAQPLSAEQYDFQQAFAMDTMTFSQWLQFIFIPRVKDIVESRGEFPKSSSVGTQAVREFDSLPEAETLITLLSEFDALFC